MRPIPVNVCKALRPIKGSVWQRSCCHVQEGGGASKIKSELVRMDLESAGTKKNLGMLLKKEAAQEHTWGRTPGMAVRQGGYREVIEPICPLASKSLHKCIKPDSGIWKKASGKLSEEQGRREGKRVT